MLTEKKKTKTTGKKQKNNAKNNTTVATAVNNKYIVNSTELHCDSICCARQQGEFSARSEYNGVPERRQHHTAARSLFR